MYVFVSSDNISSWTFVPPCLNTEKYHLFSSKRKIHSLFIIFNDDRSTARRYGVVERREYVTGIGIIFASDKKLLASVNTNIISVTGISCEFEIMTDCEATQDENILNITIYGK